MALPAHGGSYEDVVEQAPPRLRIAWCADLGHFVRTQKMADHHEPDAGVLGRGSHVTKRAYVYYTRIIGQAMKTGSRPTSALAYIIAHELGHVILPERSHAGSGLMRASWEGESLKTVPFFASAQAQQVRLVVMRAQ